MAKQPSRREKIVTSARAQLDTAPATSGRNYLRGIPEDIKPYTPKEDEKVYLKFLPWKPSEFNRAAGGQTDIWVWNFFFQVHRRVGFNEESLTCNTTYNKTCPLCLKFNRLRSLGTRGDKKYYEQVLAPIRAQHREIFLVHNMQGPKDNIMYWEEANFNFGDHLRKQIDFDPEKYDNLADPDSGWVVGIKPSKETTGSAPYIKCDTLQFVQAKEPISDAIYNRLFELCPDNWIVPTPDAMLQKIASMDEQPQQAATRPGPVVVGGWQPPTEEEDFDRNGDGNDEGYVAEEEPAAVAPPRHPGPARPTAPRPAPAKPPARPTRQAAPEPEPEAEALQARPARRPVTPGKAASTPAPAPTKSAGKRPAPAPEPESEPQEDEYYEEVDGETTDDDTSTDEEFEEEDFE